MKCDRRSEIGASGSQELMIKLKKSKAEKERPERAGGEEVCVCVCHTEHALCADFLLSSS